MLRISSRCPIRALICYPAPNRSSFWLPSCFLVTMRLHQQQWMQRWRSETVRPILLVMADDAALRQGCSGYPTRALPASWYCLYGAPAHPQSSRSEAQCPTPAGRLLSCPHQPQATPGHATPGHTRPGHDTMPSACVFFAGFPRHTPPRGARSTFSSTG